MVMSDTFPFLQRARAALYMGRYVEKNRDKINLTRRQRHQRQKLAKQQMTKKERRTVTQNNYYYRNHEKCKEYQRNYAKANYLKNREKILARKRLKRLNQNTDSVESKEPKVKEIVIDLRTWQSIPFIVALNARPEDKLSTIVNLL